MNRKIMLPGILVLSIFCAGANADNIQSYSALLTRANELIKQNHQAFSHAAHSLEKSINEMCVHPSEATFADSQRQWREAMDRWMAISVLQFGPLQADDRRLRIQAWPIRKNLLKKQIRGLLKQPGPVTEQVIHEGSVALQGLPALEFLLYQPGASEMIIAGQACTALIPIAAHLRLIANQLKADWLGEYGRKFSRPDNDPDVVKGFLDEFLNGLVTALQQIKRRKLSEPLGLSGNGANVIELESYTSQTSLNNIRYNLLAIIAYLRGSAIHSFTADKQTPGVGQVVDGFGVDDFLEENNPEGATIIYLTDQLAIIEKTLASLDGHLERFVEDKQFAGKVSELYQQVSMLQNIVEKQVFTDLGITRDFNSEDGD
jgi:uncharacterized protein